MQPLRLHLTVLVCVAHLGHNFISVFEFPTSEERRNQLGLWLAPHSRSDFGLRQPDCRKPAGRACRFVRCGKAGPGEE